MQVMLKIELATACHAPVHGYGYPAWRGGPMHEADGIGLDKILATVKTMQQDGPDFLPAALREDLVATGRSLASLNT